MKNDNSDRKMIGERCVFDKWFIKNSKYDGFIVCKGRLVQNIVARMSTVGDLFTA